MKKTINTLGSLLIFIAVLTIFPTIIITPILLIMLIAVVTESEQIISLIKPMAYVWIFKWFMLFVGILIYYLTKSKKKQNDRSKR